MKSNANRFRRLTSLALVLCLLLSSLPAAFAQEVGEESAGEETVYVAPAVQEPVTEPVAPSVEEPAAPVEEEPVPPVTEEEIVPPATEEEVVPPVTEEEVVPPVTEEEPAVEEEAEEAVTEDEPCYVTVRRNSEIFSDSRLTDSEGKVQKGAVLYKTHTEDGIYTVLFAKDGEVKEGCIKADDCEVADEDAVAEYLLLAGADENAVKHTTKDNAKIVLLNAVVTEPAAEETVPEETEVETEPQEEATEATEETEATEAAEEVTEAAEEATEETEAVEKAEELYPALKGVAEASDKAYGHASGTYWYQSDSKKVTIGWDYQPAPYCAIYEDVGNDLAVKRGVTNKNEITLSGVKFGYHKYYIVPCSDKAGKIFTPSDALWFEITTYNQTWRKAPSVKVAQDTDADDRFSVTWTLDPTAIGYRVIMLDVYTGALIERLYDRYGDKIDTSKVVSKAINPDEVAVQPDGFVLASEKAVVDKTTYKVSWSYGLGYEPPSGSQIKVQVACIGIVNDNNDVAIGKYCAIKTVKMVPQWSKAPKITSFKQTSDVECESRIEWTFTGEPDGFDFYSGRNKLFSCDAPEDTNSAYLYLPHPAPGSYSIKIVPYKNGLAGKASGAKSVRITLPWKTKKVTVNGWMVSNSELMLRWTEVVGVDGYEVYEMFGKTVGDTPIVTTQDTSCIVNFPGQGYHTYVVRPYYKDEVGTFSAPKKILVSPPPVYRAYVVGNTYSSNPYASTLTACQRDAQTMAFMLGKMSGTRYAVTTESDRSASQILSGIATAFAGAKDGDVSLFYYSGHGMSNTGDLVGNDYSAAHPDSYITFYQLREALDKIPGDKIILLDSCFSGMSINKGQDEVDQSVLENYANAAMAAFANPTPKSGEFLSGRYYVITACRKDQISSAYSDYSVFTRYFEQVCGWDEATNSRLSTASADTNRDGCITLKEAYTATLAAVSATGAAQVTRANPASSSFVMFRR